MFILFFLLLTLILVAFIILIERNIIGLSQKRKRPNIVGLWGLIQTIFDGFKLILKKIHFPFLKKFFFFYETIFSYFYFLLNMIIHPPATFFFVNNLSSILFFFFKVHPYF